MVQSACQHLYPRAPDEDRSRWESQDFRIVYNTQKGILFCQVNEAGTVFANLFFQALNAPDKLRDLGSFTYGNSGDLFAKGSKHASLFAVIKKVPRKRLLAHRGEFRKLVVVRHPLQRLVSGYYHVKEKHPVGSFRQFVKDMVLGNVHNVHYTELQHLCSPCAVDFDYVIKAENIDHEMPEFMQATGLKTEKKLDTIERVLVEWKENQTKAIARYDKQLRELESKHPDMFAAVLQKYDLDMRMFGYTWANHSTGCYYPESGCC